ncbi:MAG: hypothetical protein QNJ53_03300 [Pleurocapsa sp. MO_192.B19]|nr:hypothetical protein [Pleurocapsa sp. MO_192.B19]
MEQAIQWWYEQQYRQLTWEADQIRDRLLQESFSVRRSFELSSIESNKLSVNPEHKWIERFEIFHMYLKELSDRLSPPYLEEGLPLAIEYLLQKWIIAKPNCEFQLQLIPQWQQNSSERNRIILTTLDELLRIEVSEFIKKAFIFIDLQQNQRDNQLKIIVKPLKFDATVFSNKCSELEYLSQSFRVLTSGTWITQTYKSESTHCLSWSSKSD